MKTINFRSTAVFVVMAVIFLAVCKEPEDNTVQDNTLPDSTQPDNTQPDDNAAADFSYSVYIRDGISTVTITGYKGTGGDITIPAEIDGKPVTSIGNLAFNGCTSLTSITIPVSVTSIEFGAFTNCTSLISVTFQGTIAADKLGSDSGGVFLSPFPGDLRDKYLAGGTGTYTRTTGSDNWEKE